VDRYRCRRHRGCRRNVRPPGGAAVMRWRVVAIGSAWRLVVLVEVPCFFFVSRWRWCEIWAWSVQTPITPEPEPRKKHPRRLCLSRLHPSNPSMGFATTFYNTFAKRNSVFVTSIFVGAFAFGVGFDVGVTNLWDSWNRGKQWKDIRQKYIQEGDSE